MNIVERDSDERWWEIVIPFKSILGAKVVDTYLNIFKLPAGATVYRTEQSPFDMTWRVIVKSKESPTLNDGVEGEVKDVSAFLLEVNFETTLEEF